MIFKRYRFTRSYMVLRKIADEHRAQGHLVNFRAVNETDIRLTCVTCTHPSLKFDLQDTQSDYFTGGAP